MEALGNDRWRGEFRVEELGNYFYTVEGWVDHFKTWRKDFQKRVKAGQDVSLDDVVLFGALGVVRPVYDLHPAEADAQDQEHPEHGEPKHAKVAVWPVPARAAGCSEALVENAHRLE